MITEILAGGCYDAGCDSGISFWFFGLLFGGWLLLAAIGEVMEKIKKPRSRR